MLFSLKLCRKNTKKNEQEECHTDVPSKSQVKKARCSLSQIHTEELDLRAITLAYEAVHTFRSTAVTYSWNYSTSPFSVIPPRHQEKKKDLPSHWQVLDTKESFIHWKAIFSILHYKISVWFKSMCSVCNDNTLTHKLFCMHLLLLSSAITICH